MNLKELFDRISTEECFGYAPASSSTKPAHIANGCFGALWERPMTLSCLIAR